MAAISVKSSLFSAGCDLHEMKVLTSEVERLRSSHVRSMIRRERGAESEAWNTYNQARSRAEKVLNKPIWNQIIPAGRSGAGTAVLLSGPLGWGGASTLGCLVSGISLLGSRHERQSQEKRACRQVLAVVARMACDKLARIPEYYEQAQLESRNLQRENARLETIIREWTDQSFKSLTYESIERARQVLLEKLEYKEGCAQIKADYPELEVARVSLLRFQNHLDDSLQLVTNLEKKNVKQMNVLYSRINKACGEQPVPRAITGELQDMVYRISVVFSDIRAVIAQASRSLSYRKCYNLKNRLFKLLDSLESLFEARELYRLVRHTFLNRNAIERLRTRWDQTAIHTIYEFLPDQFNQLISQINKETVDDVPATWMEYFRFFLRPLWCKEKTSALPAERFNVIRLELNRLGASYPHKAKSIKEAFACLDQLQGMHRRYVRCVQIVKLTLPEVRKLDRIRKTAVELINMNGILEETRSTLSETRDAFVKQTTEFALFKENCLKIEELHFFKECLVKQQHALLSKFYNLRSGAQVELGDHRGCVAQPPV